MTTIRLGTVWLNDAVDPSDYLKLTLMSSLNVTTTQPGEVRVGAGGRRRVIRRKGKATGFSLALVGLERADIAWLERHVDRDVWVRDDRGRRVAGTYFEVPVDEHAYDSRGDLSLELQEVTLAG